MSHTPRNIVCTTYFPKVLTLSLLNQKEIKMDKREKIESILKAVDGKLENFFDVE